MVEKMEWKGGNRLILDHKNFDHFTLNKIKQQFSFIFYLQLTPHDFQLSSKPPMAANKLSLAANNECGIKKFIGEYNIFLI